MKKAVKINYSISIVFLIVVSISSISFGQSARDKQMTTVPPLLVGAWISKSTDSKFGHVTQSKFTFDVNQMFSFESGTDGNIFEKQTGSFSVNGDSLVFIRSKQTFPGFVTIISLSNDTLQLKQNKSQLILTFIRQ